MKRFVKILLLFLLPIIGVLCVLEYGMRTIPNDYTYKNHWLEQNISTLRIWSFGSSHGVYGIRPECFSKSAFNSAHVSQTLKYDAFVFDKFIDRADSLEWVILPISYFSLPSNMEAGEEWWRVKNYCIYYDCSYHAEPKFHCEVIGNPLSLYGQIERVVNYWAHGTNDLNCDSLGYGLGFTKDLRKEGWWTNGAERVGHHTNDASKSLSFVPENIACLESIIEKCQEKQVSVMLLTTPVCSSYSDCVEPNQYKTMVETCESMAHKYNHVQYMNLFTDSRFTEEDFFDADHLERDGAAKLTRLLDEYISKPQIEQPNVEE